MAAGAGCGESVDQYRAEVERLAQELAEANREKIRAAECGLAVLEENQALKQKYTELETEQEILRKELEQLQEVRGEDGAVILFIYLFICFHSVGRGKHCSQVCDSLAPQLSDAQRVSINLFDAQRQSGGGNLSGLSKRAIV